MAVGLGFSCLAGCSESLDPKYASIAIEFADSELGVSGSEIVNWRKGAECLVAEVRTPDDELYRVIMVAQARNLEKKPYTPWGVSQLYTLDDFVADSDVGCGVYNTNAWEENDNGRALIVR
ncbi:MAG TPA: hypothetical protein VFX15_14975 [Actinomycetes bacterium]|nr:hypothetical protein [Actinomycetes bacterium]